MGRVVIGMDPHKRSATIQVLDQDEKVVLGATRFGTDHEQYQQMLTAGRRWPQRVWAVEGCNGVGRHLAQRLVADGEQVLDVPSKLSARVRVFSTGHGRKTDATDAHSVAVVALRTPVLRQVSVDEQAVALRLLVDRRDDLGMARAQTVNRLHRLLAELVPGGAKTALTARAARGLLATVRPRDVAGRTRRRLAADLISEVEAVDKKITAATKQLTDLIAATGSTVQQLHGIGPSGAARLLGDIGDITRFPTRGHFASWNGTAPIDASSGDHARHRLSRAGNRRINKVLHIMAVVQLRHDTLGRAYYRRKIAAGKTPNEAMRALKRRLSDLVYRQLRADHQRQHPAAQAHAAAPAAAAPAAGAGRQAASRAAGSRGHLGATTTSSATGSHPTTGTSDKSLPEPARRTLPPRPGHTPPPARSTT